MKRNLFVFGLLAVAGVGLSVSPASAWERLWNREPCPIIRLFFPRFHAPKAYNAFTPIEKGYSCNPFCGMGCGMGCGNGCGAGGCAANGGGAGHMAQGQMPGPMIGMQPQGMPQMPQGMMPNPYQLMSQPGGYGYAPGYMPMQQQPMMPPMQPGFNPYVGNGVGR